MSRNSQNFNDLVLHLRMHAIRTDGPFVLRSGATSAWYLDARQTTFSGEGALLVGEAVLGLLRDDIQAVGGLTMGADPVALATAMVASKHGRTLAAFSIRKESKDHGTGGRLVGPVAPGTPVTIVEDTTSTGGAMVEAISAARDEGIHIVDAIALIDRSGGVTGDAMRDLGVDYRAAITPEDLGFS